MNDSCHSRHRSRQSSFGEVASGQKTATGHTETTRANAVKQLAVRRPPTITPRPHKGKQQKRRSTLTASQPLKRARQAQRQHEQPDRTRKPSDQGRAQVTSRPPKPKIGRPGRNLNWSGTRKSHPPRQTCRDEAGETTENIEKTFEDSPTPSPHRAYRDEEGEPTGIKKKPGIHRKRTNPVSTVHE